MPPKSIRTVVSGLNAFPRSRRSSSGSGGTPGQQRRPRTRRKSQELPLWAQGDETFETEENLKARRALRHHPLVVEALDGWWRTTDANGDGSIEKDEYVVLCMKMYKTMIEEWDPVDAQKCAERDWLGDCKGEEMMTGDHFKDAIFELADIWSAAHCTPRRVPGRS